MRITKFIEVGAEVEIDISAEDIINEIFCEDGVDIAEIMHALNKCATVMRGVPDDRIREMVDQQKNVIHDFLMEQAARYSSEKK